MVELDIFNTGHNYLRLFSAFSYPGHTPQIPEKLMIQFIANSDYWKYLRNHNITFLLDGVSLKLGQVKRDSSVGSGNVTEHLLKIISLETFLKIINAKEVEVQLGSTEIKISHEELEAMRDYASRMKD